MQFHRLVVDAWQVIDRLSARRGALGFERHAEALAVFGARERDDHVEAVEALAVVDDSFVAFAREADDFRGLRIRALGQDVGLRGIAGGGDRGLRPRALRGDRRRELELAAGLADPQVGELPARELHLKRAVRPGLGRLEFDVDALAVGGVLDAHGQGGVGGVPVFVVLKLERDLDGFPELRVIDLPVFGDRLDAQDGVGRDLGRLRRRDLLPIDR